MKNIKHLVVVLTVLLATINSYAQLSTFSPTSTKRTASSVYTGTNGMELSFNSYFNNNPSDIDLATVTYSVTGSGVSDVNWSQCKLAKASNTLGLSNPDDLGTGEYAGTYKGLTGSLLTMNVDDPTGRGINGMFVPSASSQALALICPTTISSATDTLNVSWLKYSARSHFDTIRPATFFVANNTVVNTLCFPNSSGTFSSTSAKFGFPDNNNGTTHFAYTVDTPVPSPISFGLPLIYREPTDLFTQASSSGSHVTVNYKFDSSLGNFPPPPSGHTYVGVSEVTVFLGQFTPEPCSTSIVDNLAIP